MLTKDTIQTLMNAVDSAYPTGKVLPMSAKTKAKAKKVTKKKPTAKVSKAKKPTAKTAKKVAKPTAKKVASKAKATKQVEIKATASAARGPVPAKQRQRYTESILDYVKSLAIPKKAPSKRYKVGIPVLDEIFTQMNVSGMRPGIYLFTADPGAGKTSLVLQIMRQFIEKGHPGLYLGYEGKENVQECIQRLQIPKNLIPVGDEDDTHCEPSSENLMLLMQTMAQANKTGKPLILAIDSIANLNSTIGGTAAGRRAIDDLRKASRRYNVIVLAIAHVRKDTQGRANKQISGPAEIVRHCDCRIDMIDITDKEDVNSGFREIMLDTRLKNRFGKNVLAKRFFLQETGFNFPASLAEATGKALAVKDETREELATGSDK